MQVTIRIGSQIINIIWRSFAGGAFLIPFVSVNNSLSKLHLKIGNNSWVFSPLTENRSGWPHLILMLPGKVPWEFQRVTTTTKYSVRRITWWHWQDGEFSRFWLSPITSPAFLPLTRLTSSQWSTELTMKNRNSNSWSWTWTGQNVRHCWSSMQIHMLSSGKKHIRSCEKGQNIRKILPNLTTYRVELEP